MLTVGSLFTGIGGFDLGLERAGMRVLWQCESDEFCRRALAKHWPDIECHPDIRELVLPDFVDVLCGGFPCQDISSAGRRAGIAGERSGLWSEMFRLVCELRPRYVLVENVADLAIRGLDRVLADLASARFDAEWATIPASDFGACHPRERVWLVGTPQDANLSAVQPWRQRRGASQADQATPADAGRSRLEGRRLQRPAADHVEGPAFNWREYAPAITRWERQQGPAPEPFLYGMDARLPDRLDRLAALGNALVPQIAEWLGRRIVEWEAMNVA